MRIVLCFVLLLSAFTGMAQEEIQFPDNRNKKEGYARMAEKDIKNDLASFAFAALDDRLNKLPLKSIPPTDYGANYITFEGNNVQVLIKAGIFDPGKAKLGYYEEKYLIKINGKPFFGSYGSVPQNTIASVTVIIDKDTVAVPPTALFDLYSPVFTYSDAKGTARTHNGVYFSPDNRNIYIYMLNQETIGSYEVTWVIQDKKYLRRVVDSGILK